MPLPRNTVLLLTLALGAAAGHIVTRAWEPERPAAPEPVELERQVARLERQMARLEALLARMESSRMAAPRSDTTGQLAMEALRPEVARVLREELDRLQEAGAEAPTPTVPPPTTANLVAAQEAHHLLERATHQGRWEKEQAQALHALLRDMTDAQRDEVLQRLVLAINRGELVPESPRLLQ